MLKSTPSSGEGIRILPQEIKSLQKGYKFLTSGLLNTKFFGVILGKASDLEKEIL